MQNAIINVNGQILKPGEAKVSVFDRSYLYGDSLYEVIRTYNGNFFQLEEHLERMGKSAELCQMVLGQSLEHYKQEILRSLEIFRAREGGRTEAYCRIVVSRGEGKIGFGLGCLTTSSLYTIILQPIEEPTAAQEAKGLSLQISERLRNHPRALDPAMKSGNYLNSLLAYLEASAKGFDDALLCDGDGHLTEGTTFNIFYVRRGIIATPPLEIGILDGITRRRLIEYASTMDIPVREVRFPRERLLEADEVFITSSIKEVFPVTRIDGKPVRDGKPGPLTRKLRAGFREYILKTVAGETGTAWGHS